MKGGLYVLNQLSLPIHVIVVQDIYRTRYCSNLKPGQVFHFEHHNFGRFYVIISDGKSISDEEVNEFIKYRNNQLGSILWSSISLLRRMAQVVLYFTGCGEYLDAFKLGAMSPIDGIKKKAISYTGIDPMFAEHTENAIGLYGSVKGVYSSGKKIISGIHNYCSADPRDFISSLWKKLAGNVLVTNYKGWELNIQAPESMDQFTFKSDHRHYLKFYSHAYAIRGGPQPSEYYKNQIYIEFDPITEHRIYQSYLEKHHYKIRAYDTDTYEYKASHKLKVDTRYNQYTFPHRKFPDLSKALGYEDDDFF